MYLSRYNIFISEGFFQFEIIIHVLVISYFRFIWIQVLWVYGRYKYFNSYSAVIDFRRQNLTSAYVVFWRLNPLTAGAAYIRVFIFY